MIVRRNAVKDAHINKVLVFYLIARICISLAGTMLVVSIGWHLYQATGNPLDLGLVGLMQITPMLILFLASGWAVDRFPRKKILLLASLAEVAVYVGLALSMQDGDVERFSVFSLLFLHGCARAFIGPTTQAILPNIVDDEYLSRAVAITSSAWTTASTIGPFVAGLLIARFDFDTYWWLVALSSVGATCYLWLPQLVASTASRAGATDLLSGIRHVVANPYVLPSISLDLFIVLFGSLMALLPVYVIDVLQAGPETLGVMRAMPAVGGVMVAVLTARLPPFRRSGQLLFAALLIFAASIFLFAFSGSLWLSLLALWIYGASDMISVNIRMTVIQLATPDALRGRVSAVNILFISASNELGDFRAGSVAALLGPMNTIILGAAMSLAVALGGCLLFPKLRGLDRVTDVSR